MSANAERTAKSKKPHRPPSALPWAIFGGSMVALLVALLAGRKDTKPFHPEPRAEAATLSETVMPASFFAENPRVLQTYQRARGIPAVLDGIYCHCRCKEERGHRSLLTCFQSQHGSGCDVCLGEAELAEAMAAQGKNLQEIRAQVDLAFGR